MKILCLFLVIVVLGNGFALYGNLVTMDIEIDPIVEHSFTPAELSIPFSYADDRVVVAVSPFTLNPGDVFRANIHFSNGQYLQSINEAHSVWFSVQYISTLPFNGEANQVEHNGELTLNLLQSKNVLDLQQSIIPRCWSFISGEYEFIAAIQYSPEQNMYRNGALFGDFSMEFLMPMQVGEKPFSPVTFTENCIIISSSKATEEDIPLFRVVPEPASLFLIGLGGLWLRRRLGNRSRPMTKEPWCQ